MTLWLHFRNEGNPFALPQCIIVSLIYGQCCTALPCIAETGNEGICEFMHNMINQLLPGLIAGVMTPAAPPAPATL